MYKLLLFCSCLFLACTSSNDKEKEAPAQKKETGDSAQPENANSHDGAPTSEEAKKILKDWFDEFKTSVGGYNYEAESFDFLSVTGDKDKAQINFKWTGTWHPPSTPDNTSTSRKVTDEKKTLFLRKSQGKWRVDEVRDTP